ncbi:hypothetical protein KP509_09G083700 [Ceratopteris richardii]|uniref:Uncharacterized protein n=1 Tax=Ceratopteris richardii TaxID=49495 RepID=A0A8T2U5Y5_CERRI|nr:hypothetical protein KP509_09G083700 [Ceratopteris richardii]
MTRLQEEAPANSVPAAAVRRDSGLVLFGMTGRKGHVGSEFRLKVKGANSTGGMLSKPIHSSGIEGSGISCVGIKSRDIQRNAEVAKAAFWVSTDARVQKLGEQT